MGGVPTVFPFPQSLGAPKALQCKLDACCNTTWRCPAILFSEVVVGDSEISFRFKKFKISGQQAEGVCADCVVSVWVFF